MLTMLSHAIIKHLFIGILNFMITRYFILTKFILPLITAGTCVLNIMYLSKYIANNHQNYYINKSIALQMVS